ncbi:unnamed protein product [Microthlaspi erraticum]|uniref:FAD-binding domain-containing protein n=1 Tax=Microthlaspi erraticum TaxID=1685480 RepID=A0A6D2KSU6_9BRAS|nr:unnamed protein product [Microthlaspi erraticum]
MEELDIVILGGGIAGLATSLALHRKGIKSIVLERSELVRSEGAAFGIQTNGWLALQQLGVADKLRLNSLPIHQMRDVLIEKGIKRRESVGPASYGEVRGVVRNDMVRALADALPIGTIRLGCEIVSVKLDETMSFPIVHVRNGPNIKAKVRLETEDTLQEFIKIAADYSVARRHNLSQKLGRPQMVTAEIRRLSSDAKLGPSPFCSHFATN